jgi:hypothetical protein
MLSDFEINNILKKFPKIELSYETVVHKKVCSADIIFAIPEGIKCFAWFTKYKETNVCFLLEMGNNKEITNVKIYNIKFHNTLSYGTIISGVLFKYNNMNWFSTEDIHYFKGNPVNSKYTYFINKLTILHSIFKQYIYQTVVFNSDKNIIFGIPIFCKKNEFNRLLNDIELLPYKIKSLKFYYLNESINKIFIMNYYKPSSYYRLGDNVQNKKAIFKITPDIQNDIYYLHVYNNGSYDYYDIAYIPDYKTSVLMNKLFRNIKENINLDLLEESDEEDEFENNNLDKFVYLDKFFNMNCIYNTKFRKWVPISVASKYDKVVTKVQLF